jgi:hypothetical protein
MNGGTSLGLTRWRPASVTVAAVAIAALFGILTVLEWLPWVQAGGPLVGIDLDLYRDATARWLAGGPFYESVQLAGPYEVATLRPGAILYPPPSVLLFAPFTILPTFLWYAIPVGITAAIVWTYRPSAIAWAGIAVSLWFPTTGVHAVHGNPFLWLIATVALATRWPFFGPFVLIKPTLAPFALIGITHRTWWLGMGVFAIASLLFLPMWPDYLTVLKNAQDPGGVFYSLQQVPAMMIPVFAWLGRTRTPGGSEVADDEVSERA